MHFGPAVPLVVPLAHRHISLRVFVMVQVLLFT
jgi:hypothetical protein